MFPFFSNFWKTVNFFLAAKPSGPGVFFVRRFVLTDLKKKIDIGLFRGICFLGQI